MKGSVVDCMGRLVKEKYGRERWQEILVEAGQRPDAVFLATHDVADGFVFKLIAALCKVLAITETQALDAFAEYWMCVYGPKVYAGYYWGAKSAREFLLRMDQLHETVTNTIPNAQPPRFEFSWKDERTLLIKYQSRRGLIDLMVSMTKAAGTYFKEELTVRRLSETELSVVFPS